MKKTLISLVMIVLLSLFFFTVFIHQYREKITNATITRQQLSLVERLDVFTSTDTRLTQLLASGNQQAWLHLAKLHADKSANTAYQLAEHFRHRKQVKSATLWYQSAIRQQHLQARVALAKIYYQQQKYSAIKPLLLPVASHDNALAVLYKLALQQGDFDFIQGNKGLLAQGNNAELYRELTQFSVFSPSDIQQAKGDDDEKNSTCSVDVQLFATNLTGLRHGQQLISTFKQHNLAKYICLRTPKYIAADAVKCQHLAKEKISCNASVWRTRTDITTRYLGLIVEQGGANVDNGIMYLDQQDNIDILVHELSHFIGFVDEYPLPSQHQKCQQVQQQSFAHNLVVLPDYYQGDRVQLRESILSQVPWRRLIKESTPILSKHKQGWTLSTPVTPQQEIGLFKSASCDKHSKTQAFKPLAQRTKLQYFELALPKGYIDIMALAPKQYLMPSYHYNVSRDLVELGEYHQARDVLRATQFN